MPEDGAELLAELARHGVHPGGRVRVVQGGRAVEDDATDADTAEGARRRVEFAGSFEAEQDLAERADEYLRRGFGQP